MILRGGAVHFPRRVLALFREAVHARKEHRHGRLPLEQLQDQRDRFDDRLLRLLAVVPRVAAYATFAKHLRRQFEQWFTFVFDPQVEATNWQAEQAFRLAVVNRKVWGGNRTAAGAQA